MPSAVFVVFRHQQHLKRGVIFLPLIADELHEPLCVAIQVIAIRQPLIQRTGEEVVPGITQGILQHHRAGAGEAVIQLYFVVLRFLADAGKVRVTVAFECHDLVYFISVSVYGIHRRNRHIPTPSRKTLWRQVPPTGAVCSVRGSRMDLSTACLPTFCGKVKVWIRL